MSERPCSCGQPVDECPRHGDPRERVLMLEAQVEQHKAGHDSWKDAAFRRGEEIKKLRAENRKLREHVERLQAELAENG